MEAVEKEKLRDSYLLCRTLLHSWHEVPGSDLPKPAYGWRLTLQCDRCETYRLDVIDPYNGDLVQRMYKYPDGYELDEKVTRSEMRFEWANRRGYLTEKKKK